MADKVIDKEKHEFFAVEKLDLKKSTGKPSTGKGLYFGAKRFLVCDSKQEVEQGDRKKRSF
jgi:hypothetical protein